MLKETGQIFVQKETDIMCGRKLKMVSTLLQIYCSFLNGYISSTPKRFELHQLRALMSINIQISAPSS